MASFAFEVELVEPNGRFVMVRALEPRHFKLAPGARLHECEVTHVSQPPARDARGEPRVDLFLFKLARPQEAKRFAVGQRVVLQADEWVNPVPSPNGPQEL